TDEWININETKNEISYTSSSDEISTLIDEIKKHQDTISNETDNYETNPESLNQTEDDERSNINEIKQQIFDEIDKYLPNHIICNSQLPL
ncbi:hypothetical protein II654_01545, partial [bacterium]|nr:hypothetical protein [bacterium]